MSVSYPRILLGTQFSPDIRKANIQIRRDTESYQTRGELTRTHSLKLRDMGQSCQVTAVSTTHHWKLLFLQLQHYEFPFHPRRPSPLIFGPRMLGSFAEEDPSQEKRMIGKGTEREERNAREQERGSLRSSPSCSLNLPTTIVIHLLCSRSSEGRFSRMEGKASLSDALIEKRFTNTSRKRFQQRVLTSIVYFITNDGNRQGLTATGHLPSVRFSSKTTDRKKDLAVYYKQVKKGRRCLTKRKKRT